MLAHDQSFDLYMYFILIPLIVEEQMKRALGCGFVFNTTDLAIDYNSYSLRGVKSVLGSNYLCPLHPALLSHRTLRSLGCGGRIFALTGR